MKDAAERSQERNATGFTEKITPQSATQAPTYQPEIQTPSSGFFNRAARRRIGAFGRGPSRLGGRVAGRTGSMVARLASRLAVQAGMMAARAGTLFLFNPITWIAIGVITAIVIIVFLIILGGGPNVPTGICGHDADGNPIVVTDGNSCAEAFAATYTIEEGATVTATCADKCSDGFGGNVCERSPSNTCEFLPGTCGTQEGFCINYDPPNPANNRAYDCLNNEIAGSALGFNDCGGMGAPTLTPAPTPSQSMDRAQITADAQTFCSGAPNPDTRWCVGTILVNLNLINDPSPSDYVNNLDGTSGWSWDQGYDWWVASGKIL